MSTIPRIFGDVLWDPYDRFPFIASSSRVPSDRQQQQQQLMTIIHIDWRETPEMHIFKADLPGLQKEQAKVEVEDGRVLKISGEKNGEEDDGIDNVQWHRIERSRGKFARRFRLPENANTERIKAEIQDGVLTITVLKEEIKKPHVKSVAIAGGGEKMMKKKARKLICCGN